MSCAIVILLMLGDNQRISVTRDIVGHVLIDQGQKTLGSIGIQHVFRCLCHKWIQTHTIYLILQCLHHLSTIFIS